MKTLRTTSPTEAARYIRQGMLVAFPTETVYGLGADALQPDAVRAIFDAKGRPSDNPLIVHLPDVAAASQVAASVPESARRLLEAFAPGPLTVIVPKAEALPAVVTAGLDTVGLRIPRHPVALDFLTACRTPVAAPSANRSGRPSPTSWEDVAEDLEGRIACILKGDRTEAGVESTVVDCTTDPPVVLRPGAVSVEALRGILPGIRTATEGGGATSSDTPRSPGTRHRHYAPRARVAVVETPSETEGTPKHAYIGLDAPDDADAFGRVHVAETVAAYAHEVFHFFRTCDRDGVEVIFAQTVPDEGVGRALNDRIRRASER